MKIEASALTDEVGMISTPEGVFVGAIKVKATGSDLPCDVELRAEIEQGAYVLTDVRCTRRRGGPEVTGEAIRAVPVGRILHAGALRVNKLFTQSLNLADVRAQGPTDDSLRLVARIYRMAYLVRDNPTTAVSSAIGLPYSTAARWVRQARDAGFLGPAEARKAGERISRTRKG